MPLWAWETTAKINKRDYIKLKAFCTVEEISNKSVMVLLLRALRGLPLRKAPGWAARGRADCGGLRAGAGSPQAGSLIKRQPALSKSEWQKKLTPEQFHVTREKGTEPVSYTCLQFLSRCVGCGAGQTGVDLTTKPNLVLFSQITPPSPSHMYKESQWEFDV